MDWSSDGSGSGRSGVRVRSRRALGPRIAVCLLGLALLPATALGSGPPGTVYVSSFGGFGVSAFGVGAGGTLNPLAGSPFDTNDETLYAAVTPDREYLYVTGGRGVAAFRIAADGGLSELPGSPFETANGSFEAPWGIAVSPDGKHLFVAEEERNELLVYAIAADGGLSQVSGSPYAVGEAPTGVAVSPDGGSVYVANQGADDVSAFAVAADGTLTPLAGSPFAAGETPRAMSFDPDGSHLYVVNEGGTVSAYAVAVDGALTEISGSPYSTGTLLLGVAMSPDGRHLYVANSNTASNSITAYAVGSTGALTEVAGSPFPTHGIRPIGLIVSPDGGRLYAANYESNTVSALSIASGGGLQPIAGSPFATGREPIGLVAVPEPGPSAAFAVAQAPAGSATAFDGSASSAAAGGSIARYDWDFGDGTVDTDGGPTPTHVYAAPGEYTATLTVTDGGGCSSAMIYTGQTASCTGSSDAQISRPVIVREPEQLEVALRGPGSGSVTSEPAGIACGGTCTHAFGKGEEVELTAHADSDSTFAGWSGDGCTGSAPSCVVAMSEAKAVAASFDLRPEFQLTVERAGDGAGTVTSLPTGIECGSVCAHPFFAGEAITLEAHPSSGSTFSGWSGAGCSGRDDCRISLGADSNVRATFEAAPPGDSKPAPTTPAPAVGCTVPALAGKSLGRARSALRRAGCRLGKVTRPRHRTRSRLVVLRSAPRAGVSLPAEAAVSLRLGPRSRR